MTKPASLNGDAAFVPKASQTSRIRKVTWTRIGIEATDPISRDHGERFGFIRFS
jgi:hypothetical protein